MVIHDHVHVSSLTLCWGWMSLTHLTSFLCCESGVRESPTRRVAGSV